MKLPLRDLEAARRDPASFRPGVERDNAFRGGVSKNRALQYAIYEYHRRQDSLADATVHLRQVYGRNFKKQRDLERLETQLVEYDDEYRLGGYVAFKAGLRILIEAGCGVQLTGEVSRLDLSPDGGYAVWLFAKKPYEWRNELRMPLLQAHFAGVMRVDQGRVSVGTYCLETAEYEREKFSGERITLAQREMAELASVLTSG